MGHLIDQILAFIGAHPAWAALIIGVTAFGESFVFLSLLFPGTAILVAAGALAAAGTIDATSAILAGIVGAVLGDGVSFWLGQKFGHLIPKLSWFKSRPEMLARGTNFFARYGGMSVFVGRFFGPVRAVIPLVAGMMAMPTARFYVANILSAAIWAPALVFSGMLLHRSLASGDIETKLFVAAIVVGGVVALFWWAKSHQPAVARMVAPLRKLWAQTLQPGLGKVWAEVLRRFKRPSQE